MALLMNDNDMNRLLEEVRPEGEHYVGKAWGTLTGNTAKMLALGAMDSVSCYLGITEKSFVVAALSDMDISAVCGRIVLPLAQIKKLKISRGLLPFQRILKIRSEQGKLQLLLTNNSLKARIRRQQEGVQTICRALEAASV